jgi:hypothetical protein
MATTMAHNKNPLCSSGETLYRMSLHWRDLPMLRERLQLHGSGGVEAQQPEEFVTTQQRHGVNP